MTKALLTMLATERNRLKFSHHWYPGREIQPPSEGPAVWSPAATERFSVSEGLVIVSSAAMGTAKPLWPSGEWPIEGNP